jgi:hypothetical protein
MEHKVFISYAKPDQRSADAVCAGLEERGIRCWIASRDIDPGKPWSEKIMDALLGSTATVVLLSGASNASKQVPKEVAESDASGIPLIPFRLEDVQPAGSLRYFLANTQWLDGWPEPLDPHVGRLADTITAIAAAREGTPLPPPPKRRTAAKVALAKARTATAPRAALLGLGAALVVLVAAGFLLLRGGAPEIKDVKLPPTIPAGNRDVTGTVLFKPGHDDVAEADFTVVSAQSFEPFTVRPTPEDQKRGFFSFPIRSRVPQQITLNVTLVDTKNRRSNSYPVSFEVKKASAAAHDKSFEFQTPQGFKFKIPRSN